MSAPDFIRALIADDLENHRVRAVKTRFPPEPNGYLHIGHAKSICLNFGIGNESDGATCNLRFDDTNPLKEEEEYVRSIERDVFWLGFSWHGEARYASDYFERLYQFATLLISAGRAYVCSHSLEEMRQHRGTVTTPGVDSPDRCRSVADNLDLWSRMRAGEFGDGELTLRAKIDMADPNMKMRDPPLYRIRHVSHDRTGDTWCLYPMYDFAHCLSDAIEGITHSICTLEFENNRELYDWIVEAVKASLPADDSLPSTPHQYEFARLNLTHTVLSKRKLLELVESGAVSGWDDPRMPTLSGMRRRGYPPAAIREFCDRIGVAKANSVVEVEQLEACVRDELNRTAKRVFCVLDPLPVEIVSFGDDQQVVLDAPFFPDDIGSPGSREINFTRHLFIDRSDFEATPPKGYKRLSPGCEVRLRHAFVVKCVGFDTDPNTGAITRVYCEHDADTLGKKPHGRKVGGTIHWVNQSDSVPLELRRYGRLFKDADPGSAQNTGNNKIESADQPLSARIDRESLTIVSDAKAEACVGKAIAGECFQFEREGYFVADHRNHRAGHPVFNLTVGLRDSWIKTKTASQDTTDRRLSTTPSRSKPQPQQKHRRSEQREQNRRADDFLRQREQFYLNDLKLTADEAEILSGDRPTAAFYDDALAACNDSSLLAKWVVNEVMRESKALGDDPESISRLGLPAPFIGELVNLIHSGDIASSAAKRIFAELVKCGADAPSPQEIVKRDGLAKLSDPAAIAELARQAISSSPNQVAQFRAGKQQLLGFFVGAVMKASGGRADAGVVREVLGDLLCTDL